MVVRGLFCIITFDLKNYGLFTNKKKLDTLAKRRVNDFNSDVAVVVCRCNEPMHDIALTPRH